MGNSKLIVLLPDQRPAASSSKEKLPDAEKEAVKQRGTEGNQNKKGSQVGNSGTDIGIRMLNRLLQKPELPKTSKSPKNMFWNSES